MPSKGIGSNESDRYTQNRYYVKLMFCLWPLGRPGASLCPCPAYCCAFSREKIREEAQQAHLVAWEKDSTPQGGKQGHIALRYIIEILRTSSTMRRIGSVPFVLAEEGALSLRTHPARARGTGISSPARSGRGGLATGVPRRFPSVLAGYQEIINGAWEKARGRLFPLPPRKPAREKKPALQLIPCLVKWKRLINFALGFFPPRGRCVQCAGQFKPYAVR